MLERWENIQRKKGNTVGADIARSLRREFGDEPISTTEVIVQRFKTLGVLTNEFAAKVRQEFTGNLPDSTRLVDLYYHRGFKGTIPGRIMIKQVVGWNEWFFALAPKRKTGMTNVLGRAVRAKIETVGDIRQSDLKKLMGGEHRLQVTTANFLLQAFKQS